MAWLHSKFANQGLIVLAISDESASKVDPFARQHNFPFPLLLDPDRKAHDAFIVHGIPKTFIFDREGKLAATAIDQRTRNQFLILLAKAGLR